MTRRWKLAAIGILTVGATSLASTLTTAYLMRPPAPVAPSVLPEPDADPETRPPIVRVAPPRRRVTSPHKSSPVLPADRPNAPPPRAPVRPVDESAVTPARVITPANALTVQVVGNTSRMS